MDLGLTRLLVLFSALLASSPIAVTASARPSQGWTLPASRASERYRRSTLSCSASRRSCASGALRRNAAGLASSWTAFSIWCSPPAIPRPPRASQTPLHMSTTLSSFQTLGVVPLTLLVSAGGVAAASKRPFLFSGSTCCVSTTGVASRDTITSIKV